jgi:Raf kinase inhibitor-like YbhB/YbcL family protein
VYNIPAASTGVAENCGEQGGFADAEDGRNDWNAYGYGGPCPPIGRHRYYFRLYALDTKLPKLSRPDRSHLRAAMQGHVLGEATLMGTYERTRS